MVEYPGEERMLVWDTERSTISDDEGRYSVMFVDPNQAVKILAYGGVAVVNEATSGGDVVVPGGITDDPGTPPASTGGEIVVPPGGLSDLEIIVEPRTP